MNAMIFAAGLGTRLRPLTDTKPKAMVTFMGKPLLWHAIRSVEKAGAERIVVNVHHFAPQVINFLKQNTWDSEVIISDESNELLDTGGGLIKAAPLFLPGKPVLVRNADIITSFDLTQLIHEHVSSQNNATLLVMERRSSRYLVFDREMRLCGWKDVKKGESIFIRDCENERDYGFCGIHVLNYDFIRELGEQRKFSIIKGYLDTGSKKIIKGMILDKKYDWFDVGSEEKLKEAENFYSKKPGQT